MHSFTRSPPPRRRALAVAALTFAALTSPLPALAQLPTPTPSATPAASATPAPTPIPAQATIPDWIFAGAGWGHGIGMSQYGAKGYADAGWSYPNILRHYYSDTAVLSASSLVPAPVRVGVLPSQNPAHLTANGDFQFLVGDQVVATGHRNESWQVRNEGDKFTLRNNGAVVVQSIGGPQQNLYVRYEPLSSRLFLTEANHWYAYGFAEFSIPSSGALRAVLEIPSMDRYLYGLGEVPSSWPTEAVRAQAVAARTYASEKIRRLGQTRSGCSCGVFASTQDQAYVGYDKESGDPQGRWRRAVDDTSNVLVLSGGVPIEAFYSSSSGGATENVENVWGGRPVSYLRGVHDEGDMRASPFIGWQVGFTQSDIESRLNGSDSTAVGQLRRIDILDPVGFSRRVTPVADDARGGARLIGSSGTKRVSGDRLRSTLGLRSTLFQPGSLAYDGHFVGGVFPAAGDLLQNGSMEVVTGPGSTGGPEVRVLREDGSFVRSWMAYDERFTGGVDVALGDLGAGDASQEIVTGPQAGGGPHIRVWSQDGRLLSQFFAFDGGFFGGVSIAVGNVDADPAADIVVGAGPGWEPRVRVFAPDGRMKAEWNAYDAAFRGGVRVTAGNINAGTPAHEVVTTAGPGGGPHLRIFDGSGALLGQWFAYAPAFTGGVYVAVTDVNGNGEDDILTGAGAGGGPHVRAWRGNADVLREFFATTTSFPGGVRVSGYKGAIVTAFGPGWWPLYRVWR